MGVGFKIASLRAGFSAAFLVSMLAACPTVAHRPGTAVGTAVGQPSVERLGSLQVPRHEGHPYDVVSSESLLLILAFRGGALAKAGHNHVIASHDVTGTFYVPVDELRSTFELHVPVAQLTIDEPELRAREGPDFSTDVPDAAKEGTRRNMLSEALLSEAQYPQITLVSQRIEAIAAGSPAADGASRTQAAVQITIRGQVRSLTVPVMYEIKNGELVASGELPIRQTDLGLKPFSAMLGALQVQDELRVSFHIVARSAQVHGAGRMSGHSAVSALTFQQQKERPFRRFQ